MSIFDKTSNEHTNNSRLISQLERAHDKPVEETHEVEPHVLTPQEKEILDGLPVRHKLHYLHTIAARH